MTVIAASPTPISACSSSIAGSTSPSGAAPEAASSSAVAAAPAITASQAAPAITSSSCGRPRSTSGFVLAITSPVSSAPSTAMFSTLAPSAAIPPSANSTACTASTAATVRQPSHGPSSTAASAAPSRWPLVPCATGKLSICTAKMNAAVTPTSGRRRSSRSLGARRTEHPTTASETTVVATATSGLR